MGAGGGTSAYSNLHSCFSQVIRVSINSDKSCGYNVMITELITKIRNSVVFLPRTHKLQHNHEKKTPDKHKLKDILYDIQPLLI